MGSYYRPSRVHLDSLKEEVANQTSDRPSFRTRTLIARTDLGLWDVIALDKVQKGKRLSDDEFKSLKGEEADRRPTSEPIRVCGDCGRHGDESRVH